jgi:hypothetical protein
MVALEATSKHVRQSVSDRLAEDCGPAGQAFFLKPLCPIRLTHVEMSGGRRQYRRLIRARIKIIYPQPQRDSVASRLRRTDWQVRSESNSTRNIVRSYGCAGIGRSWRIIQLMPNRSRSSANRVAKNVSCIGMNTSPPSESAEKTRSASASLWTASDK